MDSSLMIDVALGETIPFWNKNAVAQVVNFLILNEQEYEMAVRASVVLVCSHLLLKNRRSRQPLCQHPCFSKYIYLLTSC
jgi:hypothetical protein